MISTILVLLTLFIVTSAYVPISPRHGVCDCEGRRSASNWAFRRHHHHQRCPTIISVSDGAMKKRTPNDKDIKIGRAKNEERFDKWVEELRKFKEEHGHFRVPTSKKSLYKFVRDKRREYKCWLAGEHSFLDDNRVAKLESIGFPWISEGSPYTRFHVNIESLKRYKEKYGDCNVPASSKEDPQLANFVMRMRREYRKFIKGKPTSMTEERIKTLESIGFQWTPQQDSFYVNVESLKSYKEKYGDCNVPQGWQENPKLGRFVDRMRHQYKKYNAGQKSTMNKERIKALESIGFQWMPQQDSFYVNVESLKRYKEKNGDCNVPKRWKENPKLGRFVPRMRTEYKKFDAGEPTSMSEERIDLLESIGFQWMPQQDSFHVNVESLKRYKEQYGDCNVPSSWKENPKLSNFVNMMRTEYRKLNEGKQTSMNEERIKALESIGFQWMPQQDIFRNNVESLKSYKEEYGDCNVPARWKENPKLANFVGRMRKEYRYYNEGKPTAMTEERIDLLESVGFQWKLR